jgi:hypothetical protein
MTAVGVAVQVFTEQVMETTDMIKIRETGNFRWRRY